jgi:hypothetical protein
MPWTAFILYRIKFKPLATGKGEETQPDVEIVTQARIPHFAKNCKKL